MGTRLNLAKGLKRIDRPFLVVRLDAIFPKPNRVAGLDAAERAAQLWQLRLPGLWVVRNYHAVGVGRMRTRDFPFHDILEDQRGGRVRAGRRSRRHRP